MDEVLFRSSQKLERFQLQLSLAATQSKDLFQQYSQQSKNAILQAWNGPYPAQIKTSIKELCQYLINLGKQLKQELWLRVDFQKFYYNLVKVFWQKWTKRDLCFMCAGFICGSIVGAVFVLSIKRKDRVIRYMQAVQCTNYIGIEGATVVENAMAPDTCGENDVIITVKAASVHAIDREICSGYGRNLRRILQRLYNKHKPWNRGGGLPVTLGRDATGIVTDIGSNAKRLEIGDEVWVAVPFWYEGTMSQSIIVPEYRIGRKPKNIGFEGACSLPYAGSLALEVLRQLSLTQDNAHDKKVLIIGGCTPVGCVLIQIFKYWKAGITTTCSKRASPVAKALGASDIITTPEDLNLNNTSPTQECNFLKTLSKELELREKFDFIIITTNSPLGVATLQGFCTKQIASSFPQARRSDLCGFFSGFLLKSWIYLKFISEKLLGGSFNDFDEAHLCYMTLNELTEMVEQGVLHTVVDKVLQTQDIEIALNHVQSSDSIGSTIVTFR